MTGTADTEAFEFRQIYGLDVVVIPTNTPMIRDDQNDLVYLTIDEKYDAIVEDINDCMEQGSAGPGGHGVDRKLGAAVRGAQPKRKIDHNVLNAKQHEREADIIAQAGRPGRVTIATNMAGRGTDIVLGGSWEAEVAALDNASEAQVERDQSRVAEAARQGDRSRRPAHHRHRAPRVPPHRQPAAGSLRTPG